MRFLIFKGGMGMIRKLTEKDKTVLMDYVKKEKELNLFVIGDVENYGFDEDFQKVWGEFNDKGEIIGILLKFYENCIVYSRDNFDIKGFLDIMKEENFKLLSGEKSIVEKFEKYHHFTSKRDTYFCKLDNDLKLKNTEILKKVKEVGIDDVEDIFKLYNLIKEFGNLSSLESMKRKYRDKTGRGYCIKENGELVSVAQTTAENSTSAMVIGVCTHPDYRRRGYASACMIKLCKELLAEDKSLCLFYDNPKAGKIYKELGFIDIGIWSMYYR